MWYLMKSEVLGHVQILIDIYVYTNIIVGRRHFTSRDVKVSRPEVRTITTKAQGLFALGHLNKVRYLSS
jgi:hypothetical protein